MTNKNTDIKVSKDLRDSIHGYVMSDGYVNKKGILTVYGRAISHHGVKQIKFVEWLFKEFHLLLNLAEPSLHAALRHRTSTPISTVARLKGNAEKGSKNKSDYNYSNKFNTKTYLTGFHQLWYKPYCKIDKQGQPVLTKAGDIAIFYKKYLPQSINCFFNARFITLWFAGDGTKILGSVGAKFEVTAFTPNERIILKNLFYKKFKINTTIARSGVSKVGNQQWTLNINSEDYQKFRAIITEMDLIEDIFPYKLHKKMPN